MEEAAISHACGANKKWCPWMKYEFIVHVPDEPEMKPKDYYADDNNKQSADEIFGFEMEVD